MRSLAIDFGEKRIGIAISDEEGIIAYPLCIIERSSDQNAITEICQICKTKKVKRILLGYPLRVNGKKTKITERVLSFYKKLDRTGCEIILYDERWTTKMAASGPKDKMLDARAAAIMLGEYLEMER